MAVSFRQKHHEPFLDEKLWGFKNRFVGQSQTMKHESHNGYSVET